MAGSADRAVLYDFRRFPAVIQGSGDPPGGYPPDPRTPPACHVNRHGDVPVRRIAPKRARSAGAGPPVRLPTRATRPPPAVGPSRARLTVSVARSSTVRVSSSFAGSPKPGVLLPLRGSSSCVRGDLTASDSARRPPNAQNRRESGFPGSSGRGGMAPWMAAAHSARDPRTGGSSSPRRSRPSSRLTGPSRITATGSSAKTGAAARPRPRRRGSGGGAPHRPPLRQRGGKLGVRGGAAPRQPPQGTHGVWPQGVSWLNALSPRQASLGVPPTNLSGHRPEQRATPPWEASFLGFLAASLLYGGRRRTTHYLAMAAPSPAPPGSALHLTPPVPEFIDPGRSHGPARLPETPPESPETAFQPGAVSAHRSRLDRVPHDLSIFSTMARSFHHPRSSAEHPSISTTLNQT